MDAAILQLAAAPILYVGMLQPLLCTWFFPKASEELSYEMFIIINIFPYAWEHCKHVDFYMFTLLPSRSDSASISFQLL